MSYHPYQLQILQKLMYNPKLKFSDLQISALTSKHFNYHLQKLIEAELIEKSAHGYLLTTSGKDFVSKLDEKNMQPELQPKVSVALIITREGKNNREFLVTRRLKQPYYGKVGGITGKVRFGERFLEAAQRELLEETGLTGDCQFAHIHHKLAYGPEEQNTFIQDNIFIIYHITNTQGTLVNKNNEQENFWQSEAMLFERSDLFNTFKEIVGYALHADGNFSEGTIMESGF